MNDSTQVLSEFDIGPSVFHLLIPGNSDFLGKQQGSRLDVYTYMRLAEY